MTGFQNSTSCKIWPETSAECEKWWLKCKIFSADAAKLGIRERAGEFQSLALQRHLYFWYPLLRPPACWFQIVDWFKACRLFAYILAYASITIVAVIWIHRLSYKDVFPTATLPPKWNVVKRQHVTDNFIRLCFAPLLAWIKPGGSSSEIS